MVDLGGLGDKAKDYVSQHSEQVEQGVDKVGDVVNERTNDKYVDPVRRGEEALNERLDGGNQGEHQ